MEQKGKTSEVEVKCATMDSINMCVTENNLSNEIIINNDGTTYIDGNLVQLNNETNSTDATVSMNAFQDHYQLACPYGYASSYSNFGRKVKNPNVDFTTLAKNMTLIAFALVISLEVWYLGPIWEACYAVANYFKTYDPYSSCGSFISMEYIHTKGYFVTNSLAVRKCVLTLYSRHDYEGKAISRTVFLCHKYTY